MRAPRLAILSLLIISLLPLLPACTKHDAPLTDTTTVLAPARAGASASAAAITAATTAAPPISATTVRGILTSVSDTVLTLSTPTGQVQIRVTPPLHVYTRAPSDLAHVTPSAFIGVTSVTAPDGTQRATEIHIFPDELRGTGEGSRLMTRAAGGASASTMTNGTVSGSRTTHGAGSVSRMTNGTVGAKVGANSITVTYQGVSRTITIPAGVTVTAITATQQKLAHGADVVVLASKRSDGRLRASTVIFSMPAAAPK
jgi:hypothetical protein